MKKEFTKVEKYGFKKGIEIFNENETHGYFAVADDEKALTRMQRYIDSGMKGAPDSFLADLGDMLDGNIRHSLERGCGK